MNKTLLAGLLAMVLTFMSLEVHAQYVASINLSVSIPKIVRLESEAPAVQLSDKAVTSNVTKNATSVHLTIKTNVRNWCVKAALSSAPSTGATGAVIVACAGSSEAQPSGAALSMGTESIICRGTTGGVRQVVVTSSMSGEIDGQAQVIYRLEELD